MYDGLSGHALCKYYLDGKFHDDRRVIIAEERVHKRLLTTAVWRVAALHDAAAAGVTLLLSASLVDTDARREERRLVYEVSGDTHRAIDAE